MNADGTGQRNLTRNAADDHGSSWSPDGRKIAFERDRDDNGSSDDIYVINADGSGERRLNPKRAATSLVARRAEDRLHEQAQRQRRHLRHEPRRQRPAEPDPEPGEGRRLACLVTRAEIGRDSSCSERPPVPPDEQSAAEEEPGLQGPSSGRRSFPVAGSSSTRFPSGSATNAILTPLASRGLSGQPCRRERRCNGSQARASPPARRREESAPARSARTAPSIPTRP